MSHETPVRIYYEDTDMGGIVYYANYLKFIERGRSELVESLGMDQNTMRDAGIVFVVTRVVADYLAPARLDDRLVVHTLHRTQSAVRWVFDQEVRRGADGLFRAEVTAGCMTLEGRPTRLPQELRALLA